MMEVNGRNDYKIQHLLVNKRCFVNSDIYRTSFRHVLKHCKSIKCLLGMEAKYTILGTDAGTGDGVVEHMIIPI
jgi:hypothetical protein